MRLGSLEEEEQETSLKLCGHSTQVASFPPPDPEEHQNSQSLLARHHHTTTCPDPFAAILLLLMHKTLVLPSVTFCESSRNVLITNRCLSNCRTSSTVQDIEGVPGMGVEGEVVLDRVPASREPREYRVITGVLSPPTSGPEPSSSFTSRYTILMENKI
ncbi:hypothetical protein C0J52_19975 [Blattella germanica]|nr:hypothetical protein C0J52_19975 [Blattella germanica]